MQFPRNFRRMARRPLTHSIVGALTAALFLASSFSLAGVAAAGSSPPSAPFTECPHIGYDTSCGILIVINPNGSPTILQDSSQGPYDGIEDTLVGVLNNSGQTIQSMPISGPGIFGLDGDGICTPNNNNVSFSPGANCSSNSKATTGYEGPDAYFTHISYNSGTANFENGGLQPGQSTYFSLEGQVNSSGLSIDALIQGATATITGTEGESFSGTVATFTDADRSAVPGDYTATINWGDGVTTAGVISGGNGSFAVSGTHTYVDEGTDTVAVTITDKDNASNSVTMKSQASIGDAALTGKSYSISATEGGPAFAGTVASFNDANPNASASQFRATILWGDGTHSVGTVADMGPTFTVGGSHVYAEEGTYTVTVQIHDDGGSQTTVTDIADVADASLSAAGVSLQSANPVSGVIATFKDADPSGTASDYTATIYWGDGTSSSGMITGTGPFTVSGSHTYPQLGPYKIRTVICDKGGACDTATSSVLAFAYPTGGDFVVGPNATVGSSVTFWSAKWSAANLSSAPRSFKGFETGNVAPTCSGTWSARTGNSGHPPTSVPTYMAVVQTSHVSQHGSTIKGNITGLVIIKTNAGYGAAPGHVGTGTVVYSCHALSNQP